MWYLLLAAYLLAGAWTPWWSWIVLASLTGLAARSGGSAFGQSFLGIGVAFALLPVYMDLEGGGVAGRSLAALFGVNSYSLFVFAVAFSMGLVGGLAGLLGFWGRGGFRSAGLWARSRLGLRPSS